MPRKNVLKATTDAELLSYIINQTPDLAGEIDLPVQGQSIEPIGKIIINNQRYRNAFINTVNLIGLTIIKRNYWDNPWDFTVRGTLRFGQQVRELILDLCNVYDYNENVENPTRFLSNAVPNVFNYIHELNYQKFYETTTSDEQLAMAFDSEGSLFDFITQSVQMLYESYKYDTYLVDKYMLSRRILDGTVTPHQIANYSRLDARQRVSAIKGVSNLLTFRSPNYNPAGIRRATNFDDQIVIINTQFEADFSTEVLATSFFKDEADMKARMVLIDGFDTQDSARLSEILKTAYEPFTDAEITALKNIPAVIISREWFMDYNYALDANAPTKETDFYNPATLRRNVFLHVWRVFSTSPFENAVVFTPDAPSVTEVIVTPAEATVTKGQSIQLSANVTTTGFANQGVVWNVTTGDGVTVDSTGKVTIPLNFESVAEAPQVEITATSVFDSTKQATAQITVV